MSLTVRMLQCFRRAESGTVAVEYAVIATAIGAVLAVSIAALSGDVGTLWGSVENLF